MKPSGPVARRADYVIGPCLPGPARDLVKAHHYSKSASHRAFAVCARRSGESTAGPGELVAAALFLPPLPPAAKKHALLDPKRVTALHRLVVAPGEPQNVASMLIAGSLKQLRRDGRYDTVVTYADTAQGHTGAIYRATNAEYLGISKPETYWVDRDGRTVSRKSTRSRNYAEMRALGLEQRKSPGKHVFRWRL